MRFQDIFSVALSELSKNILRSLLSISGIMIGIASLIAMTALGEGTKQQMLNDIKIRGGATAISIYSQRDYGNIKNNDFSNDNYKFPLTLDVVDKMKNEFSEPIVPVLIGPKDLVLPSDFRLIPRIVGTTPEYQIQYSLKLIEGRFIADYDIENTAQVIVINHIIKEQVFSNKSVLGRYLQLAGYSMEIIGVVEEEDVYIPVSTAIHKTKGGQSIDKICILADDVENIEDLENEVKSFLQKLSGNLDLFRVEIPREIVERIYSTKNSFAKLLTMITIICLIIGGIGVMNIMLASVKERIREIGIRKSVGAKNKHVFIQLLLETILICLIGGILGIIIGIYGGEGAAKYIIQDPFAKKTAAIILWQGIFLAFGFSTLVGVVFGLYPAIKAFKINPIDALRYE